MIQLTYELIHAIGTDAGNASMRKVGRTKWNDDDWNAMVAAEHTLDPCPADIKCGFCNPEGVKR